MVHQAAGELATVGTGLDFQNVGAGEVDAQALFDTVSKKGKATGHQQDFQPRRLAGRNQFCRARVELQALGVYGFQIGHGHALEQRHAAAQAVFEIGNFAAHGRFGNGRHLGLAPRRIGNFVDALDVDQGGVHIKRDEFEVAEFERHGNALDHQAGGDFLVCHFDIYYCFSSCLRNTYAGCSQFST